jgi:hypothetical protein
MIIVVFQDTVSVRQSNMIRYQYALPLHRNRNHVLLEKQLVAQLVKKSPPFNGHEGSLPCLQQRVTGPYLEPNESHLYPHILLF